MLKNVELSDLELGMFVHKLDGNWFDHPFWKAKFLIEDHKRLQILKSSNLRSVIIDTSKGKDVARPDPQSGAQTQVTPSSAQKRMKAIRQRNQHEATELMPVSTGQEVRTAEAIAGKAKENLHKVFTAARLGRAVNIKSVEPIVGQVINSVRRNPQAFSGLMRCKLKNELMFSHALSVSALMVSLACKMKFSSKEVHDCGLAGLLLDIGVNYLPSTPDLTNGDFRNLDPKIWQQHVLLGYRSLLNDGDLPQLVLDAVLQHHEHIDGSGFPKGLEGSQISRVAQMAAICDTFDYLLTQTTTAAALDPAAAIEQMKHMKGVFNEDILRDFIESVGLYPVGSFVRLRSEKLAMVIDEDRKDHVYPIVQVFYCLEKCERIKPYSIELARIQEQDRITGIADLSQFGMPDADYLREILFLGAFKGAA